MFVARYAADGDLLWAATGGGNYDDFVTSLAVDAAGNTVVAGEYDSTAPIFGPVALPEADGYDAFVVQYDADGEVTWSTITSRAEWDRISRKNAFA